MFFVNDEFYSQRRVERYWWALDQDKDVQIHGHKPLAVCLEDVGEWLMLALYLRQHRVTVLPLDFSLPRAQVEQLASRAGCEVLLYGRQDNRIAVVPGDESGAPASSLLQLSSGTTGAPKVIAREWQDIDREISHYIDFFRQPDEMTPVIACPVTHAYGFISGFLVALARGQVPRVITRLQEAGYLVQQLLTTVNPLIYASPFLLDGVVQLMPRELSIHALMTSGSVLPEPIFQRLRSRVDHFFQQYGCSEAGCISINDKVQSPAAIGRILPHLRGVMSAGAVQPVEIVVTTASGDTIHTRDLAQYGRDGQLYYVARMDDTIIVAGRNVYPQEVETIVLDCPDVVDAVAYAVMDTLAGQRVALQIQLATDSRADADTIRQWCHQHLAPFQQPYRLDVVTAIARQRNGKISRRQLTAASRLPLVEQKEVSV